MSRGHNRKTIYEALGRESVHPFPARMAPGIALDVVERAEGSLRVLDPMMGSGTVLALARSKGHKAIGIDIDPLAVLISRVWTTAVDRQEVREAAIEALSIAQKRCVSLSAGTAYPPESDQETRQFLRYWFDATNRKQLTALASAIAATDNRAVRDALWVGFSRLIITKTSGASLAMDLSHSRPHRKLDAAPIRPFERFATAVERVVSNCVDKKDRNRGPAPSVSSGDARALPFADRTIDIVLTSPPYLNAIDYMRCSKFSLVWMQYTIRQLRALRSDSVGSEAGGLAGEDLVARDVAERLGLRPRLSPRDGSILHRYICDMRQSVAEVARVLAPGGKAVYVIGENTVRGTFIKNSAIITALAERAGLVIQNSRTRELPANRRYMPPPGSSSDLASMAARMRREVVISFTK